MKYAQHYYNKNWKALGPIILSACSIFLTFNIIRPIALLLDPNLNLLASKGFGKIIFSFLAIFQVLLFLITQSQSFIDKFLKISVFYFKDKDFFYKISKYFVVFFSFHWLVLLAFCNLGYVNYNPHWGTLSWPLIPNIIWGLFATFFLAWSEELIFRGMFYPYFAQFWKPITSLICTSFCFMFVHGLENPIIFFLSDYKIAFGLFLLGVLLNTIYVISGKLYTGMGVHMGLVAVKVILRRMPFLTFMDLRQSSIVHFLFISITLLLIIYNKEKFFISNHVQKLEPMNH